MRDPRDLRTLLLAARTGHLGPTVFRSQDSGRTWQEARKPPAFPKAPEGQAGPVVNRTFFLAPGHAPGTWWAGTVPHALFKSEDGGATWEHQEAFSRYVAELKQRKPANIGETPGGPITHSILIDPRNASHMYVSLSTGGFFETTDSGRNWRPMNTGSLACFLPDTSPEYGQDPHCVVMSPANPDRIYQQNHCGVYRLDRPGTQWDRIGRNLPTAVGDIGFPIVAHPRKQDVVWVFPMDGTSVWPRTSPAGKPAVFCSRNGGASWVRASPRVPRVQRLVHRFPPGNEMRFSGPRGALPGNHRGGDMGKPRRGDKLGPHSQPPSAGSLPGSGRAMTVRVSTHLHSYTQGQSTVEAEGGTLAELMADLDRRFPGLRFRVIDEQDRIRPHINVFVRRALVRDLGCPLSPGDDVFILGALSGG